MTHLSLLSRRPGIPWSPKWQRMTQLQFAARAPTSFGCALRAALVLATLPVFRRWVSSLTTCGTLMSPSVSTLFGRGLRALHDLRSAQAAKHLTLVWARARERGSSVFHHETPEP